MSRYDKKSNFLSADLSRFAASAQPASHSTSSTRRFICGRNRPHQLFLADGSGAKMRSEPFGGGLRPDKAETHNPLLWRDPRSGALKSYPSECPFGSKDPRILLDYLE